MRFDEKKKAFTLIEVIVAVAIFAVISAITFPGLVQFLEARDRVQQKQNFLSDLQKTFTFFARDVRFASNRLPKDDYGDRGKSTLLLDDEGLLTLTGNYPDFELDGVGVPKRVKWLLEEGTLYRVQYPVMDPDGDTRVHKQVLLREVEDVEIELEVIDDGRASTTKRWDEENKLPDLIRFSVELESGQEYERVFTMQGGNKLEVLQSVLNSSNQGQPQPGGGLDGS